MHIWYSEVDVKDKAEGGVGIITSIECARKIFSWTAIDCCV